MSTDSTASRRLPQVAPPVRQEERARQLLGDGAAALDRPRRARIADDGASDGNRVDARMAEEAMVLDGDEGVLEMRRDGGDRHVVPLLVEPEPGTAVGGVEPGVADTAGQLVDGIALFAEPSRGETGHGDDGVEQQPGPAPVGAQRPKHDQYDAADAAAVAGGVSSRGVG